MVDYYPKGGEIAFDVDDGRNRVRLRLSAEETRQVLDELMEALEVVWGAR